MSEPCKFSWVFLSKSGDVTHRAVPGSDTTYCGRALPPAAVWVSKPHKDCPDCTAKDPQRIAMIGRMLDYMDGLSGVRMDATVRKKGRRLPPFFFDGAMPFTEDARGWLTDVGIPADLHPREVPNLDARFISDDTDTPGQVVLQRAQRVPMASIRGRVSLLLPFPVLHTAAFSSGGGLEQIFGYAGSSRWARLSSDLNPLQNEVDVQEWSGRLQVFLGFQKYLESQWQVYLSLDGRPGIIFPTSPKGASEVFKLRDVEDGRDRRTALRHWVTQHWRTNPAEPLDDVMVREHLRGAMEFTWSGLHCRITPSVRDLDKAQDAKEARKAAKIDGTDRRVAV